MYAQTKSRIFDGKQTEWKTHAHTHTSKNNNTNNKNNKANKEAWLKLI